jgi:hydrogenase nickel incorporation protein HypB
MCTTCGCGGDQATLNGRPHVQPHGHDHDHDHGHSHPAPGSRRRVVLLERDLLAKNNALAADNRAFFQSRGIFALNLVSSPGSGKTTLLVETIRRLKAEFPIVVIEGDQQTAFDAERIREAGVPAVQINTGKGCHLDAHMVGHAVEDLGAPEGALLLVENVGNLVCPAGFDLGEHHKVVILSVTEGEDKPLKYPDMFAAADVMVVNKMDLLPHLRFDLDRCVANALQVNPKLQVIKVSATSGENLDAWLGWIREGMAAVRA